MVVEPKVHKTTTFINDQNQELEVINSTSKDNLARLKKLGYTRKNPRQKAEPVEEETQEEESTEEDTSEAQEEEVTEEETEEEAKPAPRSTRRR